MPRPSPTTTADETQPATTSTSRVRRRGHWFLAAVSALSLAAIGSFTVHAMSSTSSTTQSDAFSSQSDRATNTVPMTISDDLFESPKPTVNDEAVKRVVDMGLAHIALIQQPNGSWLNDIGFKMGTGMHAYRIIPNGDNKPHIGVTALCCMAFMANGNTVDRGEYQANVREGLKFILSNIDSFGQVKANGSRMYSHAFATLFLCEIYGMTGDLRIKEALHKAVSFIMKNQVSATTNLGGWRYEPGQQDADTSITVCQVQALRAAQNVGIVVPQAYIEAARAYIVGNYRPEMASFAYQPEAGFGRNSMALTAAGVVSLQSAGQYDTYRDPSGVMIDLQASLRYLRMTRPDNGPGFRERSHCDFSFWYGHYYAAQAFRQYGHVRPDWWRDWNNQNRENFIQLQKKYVTDKGKQVGAWVDEVGKWVPETNAYATAMACLILSIPNEYLPIFQS